MSCQPQASPVQIAPEHEIRLEYACGCIDRWKLYNAPRPDQVVLECKANCLKSLCDQCQGRNRCPHRQVERVPLQGASMTELISLLESDDGDTLVAATERAASLPRPRARRTALPKR